MQRLNGEFKTGAIVAKTRVISPQEFGDLHKLDQRIQQINQRISEAESEQARECRAQFEKAWGQGFEKGLEEVHKTIFAMLSDLDNKSLAEEKALIDLVMDTSRKLIGELPPKQITAALAKQALSQLRNDYTRVVIFVHPTVRNSVQQQLNKLSSPLTVTVEPSTDLNLTDCRLETHLGIIEAGLDAQLHALKKSLKEKSHDD